MIYLDNSATTALCEEAKEAMKEAMETYGNPSSLHAIGLEAHSLLDKARRQVALSLGLRNILPGQIIFTGCGTEASNLAILGSAHAKTRHVRNTVLTTDSEHPSVENCMRQLEKEGWRVVRIGTRNGILDMDTVKREIESGDVFLISMMLVNNETGAYYDVPSVFEMAKRFDETILTHCDAVQGYMKVPCQPLRMHADFMTISAHKIHGPKGIGALYVDADVLKKKNLSPVNLGGGQEFGFRSGTENMIGIAGFGAAAETQSKHFSEDTVRMSSLRKALMEGLLKLGIQVNDPEMAAPHIVNLTLPDIKSETMLHFLSSKGICVSSGSACSSHARTPSRALIAFGLTAHEADCSMRVSLSSMSEENEIQSLLAALDEGVNRLVKIRS